MGLTLIKCHVLKNLWYLTDGKLITFCDEIRIRSFVNQIPYEIPQGTPCLYGILW